MFLMGAGAALVTPLIPKLASDSELTLEHIQSIKAALDGADVGLDSYYGFTQYIQTTSGAKIVRQTAVHTDASGKVIEKRQWEREDYFELLSPKA